MTVGEIRFSSLIKYYASNKPFNHKFVLAAFANVWFLCFISCCIDLFTNLPLPFSISGLRSMVYGEVIKYIKCSFKFWLRAMNLRFAKHAWWLNFFVLHTGVRTCIIWLYFLSNHCWNLRFPIWLLLGFDWCGNL